MTSGTLLAKNRLNLRLEIDSSKNATRGRNRQYNNSHDYRNFVVPGKANG